MKQILILIAGLFLFSCASSQGFDRGLMRESLSRDQINTCNEIERILNLKAQLPKPFKLAIYFKDSFTYHHFCHDRTALTLENKNKIAELEKDLIDKKIVSDLFVINNSIVHGISLKDIRLAAARLGADAVMVIDGIGSVDKHNNVLGATYCLIITPFFIPGTIADSLYISRANLWDVRNEFLYLSLEEEAKTTETRPAFFIEKKRVINEAKIQSLNKLIPSILNRMIKMEPKDEEEV